MALSNWDTMAFDEKGQPTNGVFKTRLGVTVSIYKNRLYVSNSKAWRKGTFTIPTVMQIEHGSVRYMDLDIVAMRGPQDGVYAACWSRFYYKQRKGRKYREPKITGFVGCGVYGYDKCGKYVGVVGSSLAWFKKALNAGCYETLPGLKLRSFIYDIEVPDCFRDIRLAAGERFNQGDAFFRQHLGMDLQATKPGRAKKSHLTHMTESLCPQKTDG